MSASTTRRLVFFFLIFFALSIIVAFFVRRSLTISGSAGYRYARNGRLNLDLHVRLLRGCENLLWLHAPKTASTLCMTLHHICCPDDFRLSTTGITLANNMSIYHTSHMVNETIRLHRGCALPKGYRKSAQCRIRFAGHNPHDPIPRTVSFALRGSLSQWTAVTILRRPRDRIVSAYLDSSHHEGMSDIEYSRLLQLIGPPTLNSSLIYAKQHLHRAQIYANHMNMVGCYTKMLNGYDCHSKYITRNAPFNTVALEKALTILNKFYFVGLTEHYNASIFLLHKMAGMNTMPFNLERQRTRQQKSHSIKTFLLQRINYSDPYDDVIYAEARRIFGSLSKKYGVTLVGE